MEAALEEAKGEFEAESKAKHDLNLKLKAALADNESLAETIEEEGEKKILFCNMNPPPHF